MDRVEEIEAAIQGLRPQEYERFVEWFRAREQTRWDEQMDRDSSTGKLDFLFEEAEVNLRSREKLPKKSGYGLLSKYGPGPSEKEIDENRREMFRGSRR